MPPSRRGIMDADLFGSPSSQVHRNKQSHIDGETVCQCRKPHCPHVHYQDQNGTAGPWEAPAATDLETAFRHSGWATDRERVLTALRAANVPEKRIQRFRECGAGCVIERCEESGAYRAVAFYCGDRCCIPCARARAARGRNAITALLRGKRARLVTFTRRSGVESLTDALDHLLASFAAVRRTKIWRDSVDGGAGVIEIKRGRFSGGWHVHLHCVVTGTWIDHSALSLAWHRATGDSPVVDIREIKDGEKGVGYVCKYLGKGFDHSVFASPDDLVECITALRGRRLLVAFGDWYGRVGDVDDRADGSWKLVGSLHMVRACAERGELWAQGVFIALGRARAAGSVDPAAGPIHPLEDG